MSDLMVHAGGRVCSLEELQAVRTPPPQGRWHPTSHIAVLTAVKETLLGAAYTIKSEKYALARNDARFFGVLNLDTPLARGTGLSVGVRNSVDKSFPIGMACGSHVFVCDNLAFRAELLVRRKHTLNGLKAFGSAIGAAVASLASFKEAECLRIKSMAEMELSPSQASHIILSAFRKGIISSVQIAKVCEEYENPQYADFEPRTAFSLFNAFTEVLKPQALTAPNRFVGQTIRLNALMLPEVASLA